jgi:hypothetical protein
MAKYKAHKKKKDKIMGQLFGGGFTDMNNASFERGEKVVGKLGFKN